MSTLELKRLWDTVTAAPQDHAELGRSLASAPTAKDAAALLQANGYAVTEEDLLAIGPLDEHQLDAIAGGVTAETRELWARFWPKSDLDDWSSASHSRPTPR